MVRGKAFLETNGLRNRGSPNLSSWGFAVVVAGDPVRREGGETLLVRWN
jgi:hypothetical protein